MSLQQQIDAINTRLADVVNPNELTGQASTPIGGTLVAVDPALNQLVRVPIPDSLPASPLPPYLTIAAMLADQVSQIAGYVYIAAGRAYVKLTTNTANIADYVLVSSGKFIDGTNPNDAVFTTGRVGIGTSNASQGIPTNRRGLEISSPSGATGTDVYFRMTNFIGGLLSTDGFQIQKLSTTTNINEYDGLINISSFLNMVLSSNSSSSKILLLNEEIVVSGIVEPTNTTSSRFTVSATTRGSIPFPRMTEAQKNAIASPATGLHVYQTNGVQGVYYYNGTAWVSYSGVLGRLTPVNITTAQTITITTATQGSSYNVSFASTFTLSSGNIGGTICSINNYLGSDFELQYNRTEVLVLGSDSLKQLRIQPSTVDNGFTGVSIECMGVIGGKTAYKVYGNLTEV